MEERTFGVERTLGPKRRGKAPYLVDRYGTQLKPLLQNLAEWVGNPGLECRAHLVVLGLQTSDIDV